MPGIKKTSNIMMNNIAQRTEWQIDVHQNRSGLRHIKFRDGLLQVRFSRRLGKRWTRWQEVPAWYSPVLLGT